MDIIINYGYGSADPTVVVLVSYALYLRRTSAPVGVMTQSNELLLII